MSKWLTLIYRIPREPTAGRVYVWRKLKQLGAIALQDAVWLLPATSRTQEQFQWLAAEIKELGGEATLFSSELVFASDGESLIAKFEESIRKGYREILQALKKKGSDLPVLSKRFQQLQAQDHFRCNLGVQVRDKLIAARGDTK